MDEFALMRGELIGWNVKVPGIGIEGKIVNETKNNFFIHTGKMTRRVLKEKNVFEFTINSGTISIKGSSILMRPEDRIKIRKWE